MQDDMRLHGRTSIFASAAILSLLLIFLQEGYSYYASAQVLAMLFVLYQVLVSRSTLTNSSSVIFTLILLILFMSVTAAMSPMVVSRNSPNIVMTMAGIMVYAAIIICLPNFRPRRVGGVLHVFRYASASTIAVLSGLMVIVDLNILPGLNRIALLLQNSRLVANFSSLDVLQRDVEWRLKAGVPPRLDLYYGEPSFLAIVLFACAACYLITTRLLAMQAAKDVETGAAKGFRPSKRNYMLILIAAIFSLLYIQSLSSIIYAGLLVVYGLAQRERRRSWLSVANLKLFMFAFVLMAILGVYSYEYLLHRITTINESLSLSQRFGVIFEFGLEDYLFGLSDEAKIPDVGFHNGLLYLVAIAGMAGALYLAQILRTAYRLSMPIKLSVFSLLVVLAIVMQNGAIFSPSKVVLLALVLFPLSCARAIYSYHPVPARGAAA